jgi:hypothetical protein
VADVASSRRGQLCYRTVADEQLARGGIRHIVWDAGYGFGKETAKQSGAFILGATAFLTVVFWLLSLAAA